MFPDNLQLNTLRSHGDIYVIILLVVINETHLLPPEPFPEELGINSTAYIDVRDTHVRQFNV